MAARFGILDAGKLFLTVGALVVATAAAGQPSTDAVVRVVDIGPGLCVVISVPGGHGMLYDAGPPGGRRCIAAVRELVPSGRIDLVVLSHSDNDHISMLPYLLADLRDRRGGVVPRLYTATTIIHPGDPRGPALVPVRNTIAEQARLGAQIFNLRELAQRTRGRRSQTQLRPGDNFVIGAGRATFIAGWGDGHQTEGLGETPLTGGPLNNALSTVIRFEYGGHSVLLTGDTVGRMINDPPETCEYAERIMVSRAATVPIDSDVLIGQHHGADNGSSTCFIREVSPTYVVFSAGRKHGHPTQAAVNRLTDPSLPRPVALADIFRTDRGDNPGPREMTAGSGLCPDPTGDDDVEIRLPSNPTDQIRVNYTGASRSCDPE